MMFCAAGRRRVRGWGGRRRLSPRLRNGITRAVFVVVALTCSVSAFGQTDLSGYWALIRQEDFPGLSDRAEIGDFHGLPINEAALHRAEAWDPGLLAVPEHQCEPADLVDFRRSVMFYVWMEFESLRAEFRSVPSPILKINMRNAMKNREIWMDRRPHPPDYAAHTWSGFSVGEWVGPVLVVRTTHLKASRLTLTGIPSSDRATMTERFVRHGDVLTYISIIEDPVYLTEPLIRTSNFRRAPNAALPAYGCTPAVEIVRPKDHVPHYLFGQNPYIDEFSRRYNLPVDVPRHGAAAALPEYARDAMNAATREPQQAP